MAPLRLDLGGLHEEYVVGRAPEALTGRALAVAVAVALAVSAAVAVVVLGVLDAHPSRLLPLLLPLLVSVGLGTRQQRDRRPRTRLGPTGLDLRVVPARVERIPWSRVYLVTAHETWRRAPGEVWLSDGRRLPLVGMPRRDVDVLAQRLEEARAAAHTDE